MQVGPNDSGNGALPKVSVIKLTKVFTMSCALVVKTLCRLFKQAIRGLTTFPPCLSSDHDPLYRFHQWEANPRILSVREIKTVPYVPWSHPFIERLIGTIRRECLDRLFFWTATDLEMKLLAFQNYYNRHRTHSALEGRTPIEAPGIQAGRLEKNRIAGRHIVAGYTKRQSWHVQAFRTRTLPPTGSAATFLRSR